MKITLLAAVLVIGAAVPAIAADAAVDEVAVVDSAYNWSGVYIGAQLGYLWGDGDLTLEVPVSPHQLDGIFGGAYFGYNAQISGNIVAGVEGDFTFADLHGSSPFPGVPIWRTEIDLNWTAALRGRLGYAIDRFLPYVAGGLAIADVDHQGFVLNNSVGGGSDTFVGWTIGVGAEYAFTENLIGRAEYRYTDFGSEDYPPRPGFGRHSVDLTSNDIRFGIAYKF